MYSWSKTRPRSKPARQKLGIDRPPMGRRRTIRLRVPPLDGIWLRAPYLHNGSVSTLRDLLTRRMNVRRVFIARIMMFFDPVNVGFKEPPPRSTGPSGQLTQPYFLVRYTRERKQQPRSHIRHAAVERDKEKLLEYLKTLRPTAKETRKAAPHVAALRNGKLRS